VVGSNIAKFLPRTAFEVENGQVRGYADQLLRVKDDPLDPSNRRISLIVQWAGAANPADAVKKILPNHLNDKDAKK